MNLRQPNLRRRRGLTLIELLIVCFILVLFVALAAPLLRPATADRKVREAARQINAFMAEAKAVAAQRGRYVGLAFDRAAAVTEGSRNGNIITRLYLTESPPLYTGDVDGATITLERIGTTGNFNMGVTPVPGSPPWRRSVGATEVMPPQINGNAAQWYRVNRNATQLVNTTMLNVIMDSYLPAGAPSGYVPFRIRINNKGSWYDGHMEYTGGATPTFAYYIWAPYGSGLYPGVPPNNTATGAVMFEIEFFPQASGSSPLELPTGTCVDLQWSGFGQGGTQTAAASVNSPLPVILVFGPSGNVERAIDQGTYRTDLSRMHFLVGTTDRAIDATTVTDTATGAWTIIPADSNLNDPANQWVSINSRSGHVSTADNLPSGTVAQARSFATGLNTKGGR